MMATNNGAALALALNCSGLPCRKKMENALTCRVCGDVATGSNYDAIVCCSCKVFFRRYHDRIFQCPLEGQCNITRDTRKYCHFCRLRKCYQVGMKTASFLSDEKRLKRKAIKTRKYQIPQNVVPKLLDSAGGSASEPANSHSRSLELYSTVTLPSAFEALTSMIPTLDNVHLNEFRFSTLAYMNDDNNKVQNHSPCREKGTSCASGHSNHCVEQPARHEPPVVARSSSGGSSSSTNDGLSQIQILSDYRAELDALKQLTGEVFRPLSFSELLCVFRDEPNATGLPNFPTMLLERLCKGFNLLPDFAKLPASSKYNLLFRNVTLLLTVVSLEMYEPDRNCFALKGETQAVVLVPFTQLTDIVLVDHGPLEALCSVYKAAHKQLFQSSKSSTDAERTVCIALACIILFAPESLDNEQVEANTTNSACSMASSAVFGKFVMILNDMVTDCYNSDNSAVILSQMFTTVRFLSAACNQCVTDSKREQMKQLISRLLLPPKKRLIAVASPTGMDTSSVTAVTS